MTTRRGAPEPQSQTAAGATPRPQPMGAPEPRSQPRDACEPQFQPLPAAPPGPPATPLSASLAHVIPDVPAFAFRGAGVRLAGRWIWSDVELTVAQGEFVAVLGPNGAGKSTLLRAALGLERLSSGHLEVLGQPARRGNACIGYLPQRRHVDSELRIRGRDLVRLGLDGTRWGLPLPRFGGGAGAVRRRVDEVVDLVEAARYAHRPIGELSGGEQQRLLIAQALI
ncbi:MAG: ATP-binding cassette domain-containing protein, partial [Candidatus Dormibacteria bacterium]